MIADRRGTPLEAGDRVYVRGGRYAGQSAKIERLMHATQTPFIILRFFKDNGELGRDIDAVPAFHVERTLSAYSGELNGPATS